MKLLISFIKSPIGLQILFKVLYELAKLTDNELDNDIISTLEQAFVKEEK